MGRPDLADWKTKICLIIVPKQVEEKVSKWTHSVLFKLALQFA